MRFAVGAAVPVAYLSSDAVIRQRDRLKPGETLLVLAVAGGLGMAVERQPRRSPAGRSRKRRCGGLVLRPERA